MLPFVKVRLVMRSCAPVPALVASIATAPAPLAMPKRSSSVFAYVADCFGARKSERVTIEPPAAGMNSAVTLAPCAPALKRLSSVRQDVPPMPPCCAAAEISERYGGRAATVRLLKAVPEFAAFEVKRETLYVPGAS